MVSGTHLLQTMSNTEYKPLTVGNWIVIMILLSIPVVNIVMLIIWAMGGSTQPSQKNYARAILLLFGVVAVLGILAGLLIPVLHHMAR